MRLISFKMPSDITIELSTSIPNDIINALREILSSPIFKFPITKKVPKIVTGMIRPTIKPAFTPSIKRIRPITIITL